jgi:hypothetical protein
MLPKTSGIVPGMMCMPSLLEVGIASARESVFRWKVPGLGRCGRRNVGDFAVRKE